MVYLGTPIFDEYSEESSYEDRNPWTSIAKLVHVSKVEVNSNFHTNSRCRAMVLVFSFFSFLLRVFYALLRDDERRFALGQVGRVYHLSNPSAAFPPPHVYPMRARVGHHVASRRTLRVSVELSWVGLNLRQVAISPVISPFFLSTPCAC